MLNHMVLVIATLAISTAVAAAKDAPKREECSIFGAEEIENSIRQAPSCRRAVALFELCEFGASGDVGLGAAVTERCEGDFLSKLNAAQKRSMTVSRNAARKNTGMRMAQCTAHSRRSVAPMWRAIIQPSSLSPPPPAANNAPRHSREGCRCNKSGNQRYVLSGQAAGSLG